MLDFVGDLVLLVFFFYLEEVLMSFLYYFVLSKLYVIEMELGGNGYKRFCLSCVVLVVDGFL